MRIIFRVFIVRFEDGIGVLVCMLWYWDWLFNFFFLIGFIIYVGTVVLYKGYDEDIWDDIDEEVFWVFWNKFMDLRDYYMFLGMRLCVCFGISKWMFSIVIVFCFYFF